MIATRVERCSGRQARRAPARAGREGGAVMDAPGTLIFSAVNSEPLPREQETEPFREPLSEHFRPIMEASRKSGVHSVSEEFLHRSTHSARPGRKPKRDVISESFLRL